MNGFDNESGAAAVRQRPVPESNTRPIATCRIARPSPTSTWASNTCSPTRCLHRTSIKQFYLASVHHLGASRIGGELSGGAWGCEGGSGDFIYDGRAAASSSRRPRVTCWDPTQRSATSSTAQSIPWAFYAVAYAAIRWIWSAYQAIKHIYKAPDWSKDVINPQSQFINDVKNGNLRDGELDDAHLGRLRSRGIRLEHRSGMGHFTRQHDRPVEVLGFDCHLHLLGRLRRMVRSRRAGDAPTTTGWVCASRC